MLFSDNTTHQAYLSSKEVDFLPTGNFSSVSILENDTYSQDLERFNAIKHIDFYIVVDGEIGKRDSLEILYTMIHKKPIIFCVSPKYSKTTDLFCKEIMQKRINKIYLAKISELDDHDLASFINEISSSSVNYVLTNHETTLIEAAIKSHFRGLLASF